MSETLEKSLSAVQNKRKSNTKTSNTSKTSNRPRQESKRNLPRRTRSSGRNQSSNDRNYNQNGRNSNRNRPPHRSRNASRGTKIFIENLARSVTQSDLYTLFGAVGKVNKVNVMYTASGSPAGTATVIMENFRDAQDAKRRFNNNKLYNRVLRISIAQQTDPVSQLLKQSSKNTRKPQPKKAKQKAPPPPSAEDLAKDMETYWAQAESKEDISDDQVDESEEAVDNE